MANVLFKKGLYSSLPQQGSNDVVDGALYFAINDTTEGANQRGRLFLGDANHNLIPIGEDLVLKTVASLDQLPAANKHAGEFYYVSNQNILAFSKDNEWHQVNTNTQLTTSNAALSLGDLTGNSIPINLSITDTATNRVTGAVSIKGGTNVTVTKDGSNIVIASKDDDTHYSISAAAGTSITETVNDTPKVRNVADITLTSTDEDEADSVIKIKSTDTVNVGVDNGMVVLNVDTSGVGAVTSFSAGNGTRTDEGAQSNTQGFYTHLTTSGGSKTAFTGNIDPQVQVKNISGNAVANPAAHFVNGVAVIDAYSTSTVDDIVENLKATIDAMKYMGGVSSLADIKQNGLHNGDVYIANGTISFAGESVSSGSPTTAESGYLIIVQGDEETEGQHAGTIYPDSEATYTIVKANDTDTTYGVQTVNNGLNITERANAAVSPSVIGGFVLDNDASITLANSATNNINTITIGHANLRSGTGIVDNTATPDAQTSGQTKNFDIVTAINVNEQGHVVNYTKSRIQVKDTVTQVNGNTYTVTTASNVATVRNTVTDNQGGSAQGSFSIGSSGQSVAVTSSGTAVNLEIVWGSF